MVKSSLDYKRSFVSIRGAALPPQLYKGDGRQAEKIKVPKRKHSPRRDERGQ
jgi:hypothetical protein